MAIKACKSDPLDRRTSGAGSRKQPGWVVGLSVLGALALGSCVADVQNGPADQGIVAFFNPASSPPNVPTPTDLIRVGGKLRVPVDPGETPAMAGGPTPALKVFNDYLRSLDGYPPDTSVNAAFSGDLDPASLSEGVFVLDATTGKVLPAAAAPPALVTGLASHLTINNAQRWQVGHTYVVAVLSWTDQSGPHGVRGKNGERVIADQAFAFLRSATPLVGKCQDLSTSACTCPNLADSSCHAIVDGLTDDQARQLEAGRAQLSPALDRLLKPAARVRGDVVLAFGFTISSRPFAAFDPTRAQIPFPSDTLLQNGKVALPIVKGDPQAPIKLGLNQLDGFSTTGSTLFPIDTASGASGPPVALDPGTVLQKNAILFKLSLPPTLKDIPDYSARPVLLPIGSATAPAGYSTQVQLSPTRALRDGVRYVAILTTDIKDQSGQPLTPSPLTVLLTQSAPLVDKNGKSFISSIPDASAVQLEGLRGLVAPLLGLLSGTQDFNIPPAKIAGFTIFTTLNVAAPLQGFVALPAAGQVPTTVTITTKVTTLPAQFANVAALVNGKMTTLQLVGNLLPFSSNDPAMAATTGTQVTIPFLMSVPKKAKVLGAGSPVIIVQHGLTRWRGDALAIANGLAGAGLTMIAIDVVYHGSRGVCRADAECEAGTCSNGNATTGGTCTTRLKAAPGTSPLPGTMDYQPRNDDGQPAPNTMPLGPNRDFTNFANLFATRDNFRQHAIDQTQLVRVIKDATAQGLVMQLGTDVTLPALDNQHIGYLGQSLGSILGTNFLAVNPDVGPGVLNVGGGRIVDIFTDPQGGFAASLGPILMNFMAQPGTAEEAQLFETLRWILDPGDPINMARHVRLEPLSDLVSLKTYPPKRVILQEAGMDKVIPNEWTRRLGLELGLPLDGAGHLLGISMEGSGSQTNVSTFFPNASHGAIFDAKDPAIVAEQTQAVTYLATGIQGDPPLILPPPAN